MPRALFVEDSPTQARALAAILREAGFEVVQAGRLDEAIAQLSVGFDIVLLDLTLPDCSGLATVVGMHGAAPDVPIVVLTGVDDEALAVKALHEGAQDYLVKGQIDTNLLLRAMRYAIERKRAEEQVRTLNAKLADRLVQLERAQERLIQAERMNALGLIAAGVAHELNNPIMGVLNQIEYALSRLPPEGRTREVLGEALTNTRRCMRIVQDLLSYARPTATPRGELSSGDVNTAIRKAVHGTKDALQKGEVQLALRLDESVPHVALDEDHLQQVMLNLILNARDALVEQARRELVLGTRSVGDAVVVYARDTGVGMGPDTLGRIFEPFFTTKPPGSGTGLGLSLCKNLVESVGGQIRAESTLGKGSTFTVVLPPGKEAKVQKLWGRESQ